MTPFESAFQAARRKFLTSAASGLGLVALSSLLQQEGLLADDANPLAPKQPHHPAKAKACIFILPQRPESHRSLRSQNQFRNNTASSRRRR